MQAEPIFDGLHARARLFSGHLANLVVIFDFYQPHRVGFLPCTPPSAFMSLGFAVLWVQTAANDWFLNPELEPLRGHLAQTRSCFERVVTLGFSMGGYGSLLLSGALRPDHQLLVSPQISIFPERAPWEGRYHKEAACLDPRLDDLDTHAMPGAQGVILYDPMVPEDRAHAVAFGARFPTLQRLALPWGGHPATLALTSAGHFDLIRRLLVLPHPSRGQFARLHREVGRTTPRYQQAMLAALHAHHPHWLPRVRALLPPAQATPP